ITMSVRRSRRRNASCPAADFRSRTMPRLPRLTALKPGLSVPRAPAIRRVASPEGGSTLITSAPMSHSCIAQKGPAITCVTSSTRIPSSAVRVVIAEAPSVSIPEGPFETAGPLAFVTFNRPPARHALPWPMYDALVGACDRVDADDTVRVFVVRAAGDAFAAGTDIRQFTGFASGEDGIAYERRLDAVIDRLPRRPRPRNHHGHRRRRAGGGCRHRSARAPRRSDNRTGSRRRRRRWLRDRPHLRSPRLHAERAV